MCAPAYSMAAAACSPVAVRSSAPTRRSAPCRTVDVRCAGASSSGRPNGGLSAAPASSPGFAGSSSSSSSSGGGSGGPSSCSVRSQVLYAAALEYYRTENYDVARRVFEKACSECPTFVKPWVSWAQMEKRCNRRTGDDEWWEACRKVLWSGLQQNKDAPALLQAWGLLEMQRGNWVAAILLLDRSALLEPRNRPVLRWKPVMEARRTIVGARWRRLRAGGSAGGDSE